MKWFKHSGNSLHTAEMEKLIMKYGIEGYGVYWACVEMIAGALNAENPTFELKHDAEILAHKFKVDTLKIESIMKYCIELGLFELNRNSNQIFCLSLLKMLDISTSNNPEIKKIINNSNYQKLLATNSRLDEISLDKIKIEKIKEDNKEEAENANSDTDSISPETTPETTTENKNADNKNVGSKNILSNEKNKNIAKKNKEPTDKEKSNPERQKLIERFYKDYEDLYSEKLKFTGRELGAIKQLLKEDKEVFNRKYQILLEECQKENNKFYTLTPSILLSCWNRLVKTGKEEAEWWEELIIYPEKQ